MMKYILMATMLAAASAQAVDTDALDKMAVKAFVKLHDKCKAPLHASAASTAEAYDQVAAYHMCMANANVKVSVAITNLAEEKRHEDGEFGL